MRSKGSVPSNAPPVLLRKAIVGERLFDRGLRQYPPCESLRPQLTSHCPSFGCVHVLACTDSTMHRRFTRSALATVPQLRRQATWRRHYSGARRYCLSCFRPFGRHGRFGLHAIPDWARNFYAVLARPEHEINLTTPDFAAYSSDRITRSEV